VVELSVRAKYGIGVEVRAAVAEEMRKRFAQPDRPADSSCAMLERARTFVRRSFWLPATESEMWSS
jgi:hypothetical protein